MQAQSADGVIHDFPAGTDMSVIDRVMKSYATDAPAQADAPAGAQAAAPSRNVPMTPQQMYGGSASDMPPGPEPKQPQIAADFNAVGQGLIGGTGAAIAGAGRIAQADSGPSAQRVLATFDLIDQGKNPAYQKLNDVERWQVANYRRGGSDDQRTQRDTLQQTIADYAKPNALTRAGMAVEGTSSTMFPVAPENEGIQTGVGRLIGGAAPALTAGAVGGPVGVLASLATIGSQAYDGAYQDAVSKGATHEDADDAAGKSALAQSALMVAPVGRLLQRVPMPFRDGLTATLVNLGQHGVEFGTANALGMFANNYVASQTYDPDRSLTQGTGNAAIEGTIAGLIIPAVGGMVRGGGRAPAATVDDVMAAPNVDSAIKAAGEAAQAPSATPLGWSVDDRFGPTPGTTGPAPQPASRYGAAPGFVPPGTEALKLPRILALLNEDDRVAANRPAFVPPDATQPSIPTSWSELFARNTVGGDTPAAPGPVADPVPQSAGAAASRDMTHPSMVEISTADMKANRRRAEMDEILLPPQANDSMIHVAGSFPTLAERSGDPLVSQYENLLRQRNPGEFIGEGKVLTENNKARVNEYDANTVTDPTLNSMRKDRAARWAAASDNILPNAKPVDLTPALDWVEEQLSNPRIQENDAVRSVLENFRDRLINDAGDLKTDPAAAWGIHDNLQNQLAKAKDPLNATSAEKYAESQILTAKSLIDKAMNVATDNRFQTALDRYAEDSKAINSGVLLNDFRPKLTNMSGELQAANFHRFVVSLAKERGDPGIDPSMDISDQTMRSLINIDTDLKRAGLIKLGSAAGSPTNLLGALAEKAGLDAAHSVLGAVPMVGPLLSVGQKFLAQRKLSSDTAKHLAPPKGGYSYPFSAGP